jgi:O-antigen/teichoic acid export membrane protein
VLGPHFARLHAAGQTAELQALASWSARIVFVAALPVAAAFVVAGGPILAAVFGPGFERGAPALAILAFGQWVGVGAGSGGLLLNMCGRERDTARGLGIAAAANVALNAVLVPRLGLVGAAIATATTLVGWRALLWRQARRRLGVDPSILGAAVVPPVAGAGARA